MSSITSIKLSKIGKNPRALKEFIALKEEIGKLGHPARPDINWNKIEELCQLILQKNGADLQSMSYHVIALTKLYGLPGLLEGITCLDALIGRHWSAFWPEQTHVRVELIGWLVKSIQQFLRAHQFSYTDLPSLYHIERKIDHINEIFQELEIKHLMGMEGLSKFISKTAKQLERLEQESPVITVNEYPETTNVASHPTIKQKHHEELSQSPSKHQEHPHNVSFTREEVEQTALNNERLFKKKHYWKGFLSGSLLIIFISCLTGGILFFYKNSFIANSLFFPQILNNKQIDNFKTVSATMLTPTKKQDMIVTGQSAIRQINTDPLWSFEYGNRLLELYQAILPNTPQIISTHQQWHHHQQLLAEQFAEDHSFLIAQTNLQKLMDRLNNLDERHGKYITVSELKTIVFSIQRPLLQSSPLEELLRIMKEQKEKGKDTSAIQEQINTRLLQILNYYYLMKK